MARRKGFFRPLGLALLTAVVAVPLWAQRAPAPRPGDTVGWHVVRPGETLEAITDMYLGTPILWRENWRLNPTIKNPDLLRVGQRLRVIVHRKLPKRVAEVEIVARRVDEKPHPNPWIPARPGDLLKERDGLRTHRNSSATLRFGDGLRMEITEESLVFLDRLSKDVLGRSKDGIEIVKGQADLELTPRRRHLGEIEVIAGSAHTKPQPGPSGSAASRVARSEDGGARVMVYRGRSLVASAGDEIEVPHGMGTAVPKDAPPSPPEKLLPAPVLDEPAAGWNAPWANPTLQWNRVDGAASYTVEVFGDEAATKLVLREPGVTATSWEPSRLPRGRLFWRVTAVARSGLDGYPSRVRSLQVSGERADLEPPVVVAVPLSGVQAAGDHLEGVAGGSVRLVAHDDVAGVRWIGYRWDDGPWRRTGKHPVRLPEQLGHHVLQFRAMDRRGRQSRTWTVAVDTRGGRVEAPRVGRGVRGVGTGR